MLVRHGHAAAGWDADLDPGLDDRGRAQADAAASDLAAGAPLAMLTSPLRRALETAAPLERRWGVRAAVCPPLGEIPSPTTDLAARGAWLQQVMAVTWDDVEPALAAWRSEVLGALAAVTEDAVVFTHFIAINVAVGAARGDRRVVNFLPDYVSRTVIAVDGEHLDVVELGAQAPTAVR